MLFAELFVIKRPHQSLIRTKLAPIHMATLIFRIFSEIKAIGFTQRDSVKFHSPIGVDTDVCVNNLTGHNNILLDHDTCVTIIPELLPESFYIMITR